MASIETINVEFKRILTKVERYGEYLDTQRKAFEHKQTRYMMKVEAGASNRNEIQHLLALVNKNKTAIKANICPDRNQQPHIKGYHIPFVYRSQVMGRDYFRLGLVLQASCTN